MPNMSNRLLGSGLMKTKSKIKSFEDVKKALQDLEKAVNEISESLNKESETEVADADGKTGDTQATRNADGTYNFEIKTIDGWKTPVIGKTAIKFTDKPASISKPYLKNISDIETEDTSTGASDAEKTIFDEKDGKFKVDHLTAAQTGGLMKPDYDSGWNSVNRQDSTRLLTLTHNIESPVLFKWMVKDSYGDNAGNDARNAIFEPISFVYTSFGSGHAWIGVNYYVGSTTAVFESFNSYYMHHEYTNAGGHEVWNRMDVRLVIWK